MPKLVLTALLRWGCSTAAPAREPRRKPSRQPHHLSTSTALAFAASLVLSGAGTVPAASKTPGATHCFLGVCHRVLTIQETAIEIGKRTYVVASHYDHPNRDRFNPRLETSSGEIFRPDEADSAASPSLPDGTIIALFAPSTGRGAIVRINNAGPYWGGRKLDVSRGLAERLDFAHRGIAVVAISVLRGPSDREAVYSRARRYAPVPGYIGAVADLAAVEAIWWQCNMQAGCSVPRAQVGLDIGPAIGPVETVAVSPAAAPDGAVEVARPVARVSSPALAALAGPARPSRAKTRVVLLPVKQRRPAVLARVASAREGKGESRDRVRDVASASAPR